MKRDGSVKEKKSNSCKGEKKKITTGSKLKLKRENEKERSEIRSEGEKMKLVTIANAHGHTHMFKVYSGKASANFAMALLRQWLLQHNYPL